MKAFKWGDDLIIFVSLNDNSVVYVEIGKEENEYRVPQKSVMVRQETMRTLKERGSEEEREKEVLRDFPRS